MDKFLKMKPVLREAAELLRSDPDATRKEAVEFVTKKWGLDKKERKYLKENL